MIQLRPHQEYTINKIIGEIDKHNSFFINMSTGGGKTLTILLLSKMIKERGVKKVLVATRTKNEFTPYFRDVTKFNLDLNTSCLVGKDDSCSMDILRSLFDDLVVNICKECFNYNLVIDPYDIFKIIRENCSVLPILSRKDVCPYYSLKRSFRFSDIYCVTYPYIFTKRILSLLKHYREYNGYVIDDIMLIIDEAHNLDGITELYESKLNVKLIDIVIQMCKSNELLINEDQLIELKKFIENNKSAEMKHLNKDVVPRIELRALYEYLYESRSMFEITKIANKIRAVSRLVKFFERLNDEEFDLFSYNDGLILKMVLPSKIIRLFTDIYGMKVLMSGTLPPNDYINKVWAIDGLYIDVDKEFKLYSDQRLGYLVSNVTTRYTEREKNYGKYAKIITELCEKNNDVKLIVYPSYDVMKNVLKYVSQNILSKSIVEDLYTKIEYVKDEVLRGKINIHAVAGGKLTEGIELVDENGLSLIKYVVLVGVPYPDVNDYMKVKSEKISKLVSEKDVFRYAYYIPALLLSKQAIGRAIRSEKDKVKVLLLDWRFRYFIDELNLKMVSNVILKL